MKTIKSIARILIFFVLLLGMLGGLSRILEEKQSVIAHQPFLDHAQEYDVLLMGDSQVLNGVFPLEMYHDYGIAAYNMGTSNCVVPMTYWKLVNALDYASPKLVLLSVTATEHPYLTGVESEWLHVAFDAFPLTPNKVRTILELTDQTEPDRYGLSYRDVRADLFFPLRIFHSRWSELTAEDFHPAYNTQKGAKRLVHVSDPQNIAGLAEPDECIPETSIGFVYLRRAIELCQERGIPLLLFQPPYAIDPETHKSTHTAQRIADEYGVPMLNFTDMDRFIDLYTDCADPGSHINVSGALKQTDYLGRYLTDHYDLPDRREDSAYAHWNDEWDAYVDEKIRAIKEDADSLRSRLILLHDSSFSLVLTIRPGFNYHHRNTVPALQNIARPHAYEGNELVFADQNPLEGLQDAMEYNEGYMLIVDRDAECEEDIVQEFYGISEREFETSFGTVFCRMDGEWIDTSLTRDDEEVYYFDSWEEQDEDMRLLLIDRRTKEVALAMAFSRTEEEQP